jgi:hypothetical protein
MKVGVVFDSSALLAHLRLERISAGELISVVAENGDVTGIPALTVLDVMPELGEDDWPRLIQLLASSDDETVVLPLMGADVLDVGRLTDVVGSQGVAHAVVEAHRNGTSIATCNPVALKAIMHPDDVEELS